MGRHEQREQIFKLLFREEFHAPGEMDEQAKLFFEDEETIGFSEKDTEYIAGKCCQIREKLSDLDRLINEKAQGWDTARMGKVELTILRLGVFEVLFDKDIPEGVAINEAVELAKNYGQENAGSFVNAVLAKFVKAG